MENTESNNLKPQQTGGLKLMTVFIAVLALHVVVIGGFTVYHLLSAATSDPEVALDKNHKGAKVLSDGALAGDLPQTESGDKAATTTPAAPATETASTATPSATPVISVPMTEAELAPTGPTTAQTPSGPIQHGPVINPPESLAPSAPSTADATSITAPATPVGDGAPYVVKSGDSLARIARQHHVTLAKLKAANSLSSDKLHIGQKMVIPNRTQTALATSLDTTASAPDATAPMHTAPRIAAAPAAGRHLYTVVKGDTLIKIARKFKTTPSAIMTANSMTDAARLSIGKKLRIPSAESRSAAAGAPPSAAPEESEPKAAAKGQLANYRP